VVVGFFLFFFNEAAYLQLSAGLFFFPLGFQSSIGQLMVYFSSEGVVKRKYLNPDV